MMDDYFCCSSNLILRDKTPFYFIQEVVWNYAAGVA
ncbi:hypothetical protein MNBD_GAMMA12-2181, partial [hydrothermal vent metagenome]